MKRDDVGRANYYVGEIEHLEDLLEYMRKHEHDNWGGAYFTVQFNEKLSYRFPDTVSYSMFHNVLKSSIENDLETLNKKLESL